MKKPVHHHLFFGEGEINFCDTYRAIREVNCQALINVELSHHSHDAVNIAKASFDYLKKLELSEEIGRTGNQRLPAKQVV
jgi:sugar phosphate isomerase/epimerase